MGSPTSIARFALMITSALFISTAGCSSTSLLKVPAAMLDSVRPQKSVGKILCLWEPAEGQGIDEKPSRGFAGQILFFAPGEASPIKTKGIVRIFEYADFDSDQEDPKPIHQFNFDSGAWAAHHTESTLGHSYNVFLPLVQKRKGHVVCALRVEYESESGQIVSSPYTSVTLASKTSHQSASALQRSIIRHPEAEKFAINKDGASAASGPQKQAKLESLTIQLPGKQ